MMCDHLYARCMYVCTYIHTYTDTQTSPSCCKLADLGIAFFTGTHTHIHTYIHTYNQVATS